MKILQLLLVLTGLIGVDASRAAASTPESGPKVILLTSFERPRLEKKLEHIFRRKMKGLVKKGWKIESKSRADAYDLHEALTDDTVDGVIWVSHGSFRTIGATRNASGTIAAKPMLLDHHGDDVASVLTLHHDQLKFLSVVGCNSKQILDYQNEKTIHPTDLSELETYIPDHKVVAQWALRRASKRAMRFFQSAKSSAMRNTKQTAVNEIEITRIIPDQIDSNLLRPIRVYLAGKLIGVLDKGIPGKIQTARFHIPAYLDNLPDVKWKFRIETGQHVETNSNEIVFGDIQFKAERALTWKIFADAEGIPFGQNFRLYLPEREYSSDQP